MKLCQRLRKDIGTAEPVRTEADADRLNVLQGNIVKTKALLGLLPVGDCGVLEGIAILVTVAGTDVEALW